jgi:membrane protein DedA with SNARE-associated domain
MLNDIITYLNNLLALFWSGQLVPWSIWSYIILGLIVAVEGPIATLLGAAAASAGLMHPGYVFLAASIGNLSADSFWYSMGYLGKIEWFLRFGKRLGISQDSLVRLQAAMQKHAARILFFAKLSVSMIIPSLVAAGLIKAPWRKWFPFLFCGEMIWTGSLVFVGYHAARALTQVGKDIEIIALIASIIFMGVIIFMGRRILKAKDKFINQG